jgi:hypothetical protein
MDHQSHDSKGRKKQNKCPCVLAMQILRQPKGHRAEGRGDGLIMSKLRLAWTINTQIVD